MKTTKKEKRINTKTLEIKKTKTWYTDGTVNTTIFKPDGTIVTYNQSKRRV